MEDTRIARSREYLTQAFLLLLEKKAFDDISVTDLCKKAGVSRQTFYRIYERKEDVLLSYLDKLLEKLSHYDKNAFSQKDLFYRLGLLFYEEQSFLKGLFMANLDFHIIYRFEQILKELRLSSGNSTNLAYREVFFSGGTYNVLRRWLMSGAKQTPLEIAAELERLTSPILNLD